MLSWIQIQILHVCLMKLSQNIWAHINKISDNSNIGFSTKRLKSHKEYRQQNKTLSRRQAAEQRNKQVTIFLVSHKSMVELMNLESDKGIICFVLFWLNLCFERMFNDLWWYTCSQIKLYKNVLLYLFLFFCSLQYLLLIFCYYNIFFIEYP